MASEKQMDELRDKLRKVFDEHTDLFPGRMFLFIDRNNQVCFNSNIPNDELKEFLTYLIKAIDGGAKPHSQKELDIT